MDDEYKIELNLTDAPPVKYPYAVGTIAPTAPFQEAGQKSNMSYLEAFGESQLAHRIGVWSAVTYDKVMRSYDQKDNLDNKDPTFDPFTVWKENKHQPDDFNAIGNMKNWDEYSLWKEVKDYENEAAKRISESGGWGQAATLLDPTLLIGFGAEGIIGKGLTRMGYGRTGVIAGTGVASVAAYEAGQQVADITDRRDVGESVFNIAAAGVIGGLLGKATETWATRAAKGKLQAKGDFHQAASQYIQDAQTLETRAQSVGAAAVAQAPEDSRILGTAARFVATKMKYLSPKLYSQTAAASESRSLGDMFFGRNQKTIADEQGIARGISVGEESRNIVDQSFGQIAKDAEEIDGLIKTGQIVDDAVEKEAILLAANGRKKNLSGNGVVNVLARQYREFFGNFNKTLNELKVKGYNTLNDYAVPLLIKAELVNKNIEQFSAKVFERIEKVKHKAEMELSAMANELDRMKMMGAKEAEILEFMEEMRVVRELVEESAGDSLARARTLANMLASGMHSNMNMGSYVNKLIPNRFKQRILDFETFIDFVETDPARLKALYSREVAPFIASQKVLGDKTPVAALEMYMEKMNGKVAALRAKSESLAKAGKTKEAAAANKEADALRKEAAHITDSIKKGWDVLTGEHLVKQVDTFSAPVMNVITAAKHFTSMTKLGGQVLASLTDMSAIAYTHHLKGVSGFSKAIIKAATSPELRKISKKNALTIGVSFEKSIHAELMNNLANDFTNAEIFGTGATGKLAKAMQYGSSKMQVYNGVTTYDTIVRRALSVAQQGILKNNLTDLVAGRLAKNDVTDLAFLGIDKVDAGNILAQMKTHGSKVDDVFFANSHLWDDKAAKEIYERALLRDNRRTSLRPSVGDTPFIFGAPVLNLLTQFKSWSVTATQVYGISALQRADAKHLMGITTVIGLASLANLLNDIARGNEVSLDLEELIWGGINTSGILGVLPDYGGSWLVNTYADINAGGGKYSDYQTPTKMLAGPAASTINDLWGSTGRPVLQGIDPDQDVNWQSWQKSLLNSTPLPFVKPIIKNELFGKDK